MIKKFILIGDGGVGKTSYCNRISKLNDGNYKFEKNYVASCEYNVNIFNVQVNDKITEIHLWDTVGQEKNGTLRGSYIYGSDGVIILYDKTNPNSKQNVRKWINVISKCCKDIPVAICGNKMDQPSEVHFRRVDLNNHTDNTYEIFDMSVKQGKNIKHPIEWIINTIEDKNKSMFSFNPKKRKIIFT